ncbi:MBL fold metallo-hydrolase [Chryseobacterium sp. JV558]|uniref:MBL fold metallo-hydrolase n=1 Tax=Chryseobacterium sp. JV558 TaxID=2663236 RepID=UPI00299E4CE0|nr:MBL fold metallo-hydrolase [Chryseobacterium sp. JV558]MDW9379134.1 MBL fold metallo-hydrolase [Chryseobacterium sp. JV558]
MKGIEAEFSFFKAGQGSFYGGRIWYREINKIFTVVYDCGTSRFISGNNQSLNNEIDYLKHNPYYHEHNNEIELLFISHLDYDHVSGLKRLLREFNVKNIILPYIEKQDRQFFLISIYGDDSDGGMSLEDYASFIDNPSLFIIQNSEGTKIYFINPDTSEKTDYQGYDDNDSQSNYVYPRGTRIDANIEELSMQNVLLYENNLQFFIKRDWEFTTYVKNINQTAINNLHNCLRKELRKNIGDNLSLDDLKEIIIKKRKAAHDCYTSCIGEINSHGLVLLHGPIRYDNLYVRTYSNCDLKHYYEYYHYPRIFQYIGSKSQMLLGTLLFGDTSIKPDNNPINFPQAFKNKLVNVHIVQVPHHGSSENWDFEEFQALNIGDNIHRWRNSITTVCNFGYGNTYGHPSHNVLHDLSSTIFLNSQFSRLNIQYIF